MAKSYTLCNLVLLSLKVLKELPKSVGLLPITEPFWPYSEKASGTPLLLNTFDLANETV